MRVSEKGGTWAQKSKFPGIACAYFSLPSFLRLLIGLSVSSAAAALVVFYNFSFLRRLWESVKPMGPSHFLPSPVDPVSLHLRPVSPSCCSWWRSDYLPFEQCSSSLLKAAKTTVPCTTHLGLHPRPLLIEQRPFAFPQSLSSSHSISTPHLDCSSTSAAAADDASSSPVEWVTHVTSCNSGNNRLARAVAATGIPLTILGLGTFWKSRWGFRMRVLHDYLVALPEDKLIIFSDADDVIPVPAASAELVAERYKKLVDLHQGPRVFFAAEVVCYPRPQLWSKYTPPEKMKGGLGRSPFKFLNAGIMVGPAGLLRRMLEVAYQGDCSDDQYLYTLAYLDPFVWWTDPSTGSPQVASTKYISKRPFPPSAQRLIGLDHWNVLTMAMYGMPSSYFSFNHAGTALGFSPTNSTPLLLHQNGNKRLNPLLEVISYRFGYHSSWEPSSSLQ